MNFGRAYEEFQPEDLFPVWCWIDDLERAGVVEANDALQWKLGIFELMERWGLGPDDLVPPLLELASPAPP